MNWIISANPNVYDVVSAFNKFDVIDWRQSKNHEIGDIIYIYCSGSIRKIKFKCIVEDVNIPWDQINDDKEFWIDKQEYLKSKTRKYMRLCLQQQIDYDELTFENLKENGLKGNLQGPMKLDSKLDLLGFIENSFNNDSSKTIFPDEIPAQLPIFEGHKKTVFVNQYERSAVARKKCVEHHGCYCQVCKLDFEKMYGSLGKGFIHVHHKIPLSQIGDEYEVDYVNDLIPVCPNCHAMLHRKSENGTFLTPEKLMKLINGGM
ncbi:HNH endonuclease [Cytobacillus firmus]|uniref:HNH endonuclease n=1 Tax=Bacillaceae TaxID=186817 RepID=UPI00209E8FDD|nr:HNH endonuclease [Priestia flexa]MCP1190819.1 HNH endonuclease [Priestia flexa]